MIFCSFRYGSTWSKGEQAALIDDFPGPFNIFDTLMALAKENISANSYISSLIS